MRKTQNTTTVCSLLMTIISLLSFSSNINAQIVLTDVPIPVKPAGYYIAGVQDNRADKSKTAAIIIKNKVNQFVSQSMALQGGPEKAIKQYLDKNLQKNPGSRPVMMGIESLKIEETASATGRIEGKVKINLTFALEKNYGLESLTSYPGVLSYQRGVSPDGALIVEKNLRRMIGSGLSYFNDWMLQNLGTNPKLARGVKIRFTDFQDKKEGDTIYYDPKRPLTWADFQSKNRVSDKYQASVMPSIGYTQEADLEDGILKVQIAMKTYVPKSACWANPNNRNDYYLNHEQRHFDIAKISSNRFKKTMMAQKLSPDDYEGIINMQYLDAYRAMNDLQKAYDDETNHGLNNTAQDRWNDKIDQQLND